MIEHNDCEKREKSCFTRLFETCGEYKCLAFCHVRRIFVKSRRRNEKYIYRYIKTRIKRKFFERKMTANAPTSFLAHAFLRTLK